MIQCDSKHKQWKIETEKTPIKSDSPGQGETKITGADSHVQYSTGD